MSNNISKALRHRRFRVKHTDDLKFVVETKTGLQVSLVLENCSLTGLGAKSNAGLPREDGFEIGAILPASKISWQGHEYSLGRLVVRTFLEENGSTFVGLSTVDSKVPIDGDFSKFLILSMGDQKTPYDYELSPDKFSSAHFIEANYSNVDLFARTKQYQVYFGEWEKNPKYGYHNVRLPSKGCRVNLARPRKGGRNDYIIMGSNDYLGLAAHPEVLDAARKALDEYGFGSTGSPCSTGITRIHEELCDFIARLLHKEEVILFNSGYTANVGVLSSLTGAQDFIAADFLSHASIRDGLAMTKATSRFFKHNNMDHLGQILDDNRKSFSGSLIVTEGVFSMDGDVPPLDKLVKIARDHNCRIMVDEAHSFGVVGPQGLGACAKHNVTSDVDIMMGTFSKIAGSIGGFIASTKEVINWLWWLSRAHVFTVSVPPSTAAATLKSLQIFVEQPMLLAQLRENVRHFVSGLRELGFDVNPHHESAVVPVIIGDEKKLGIMNQVLMDAGVFCVPMVYPVVSRKLSRFRFTVTAAHTISDLDYVLTVLQQAMTTAEFVPQTREPNKLAIEDVA